MDTSQKYEYNHQVFRLLEEVLISGYTQRNGINPFKAHNQAMILSGSMLESGISSADLCAVS